MLQSRYIAIKSREKLRERDDISWKRMDVLVSLLHRSCQASKEMHVFSFQEEAPFR
jgi:hypothetical protein